jgi:hypothetical protein
MNLVEIFVAFGAGYVSGLSISSGFYVHDIRERNRASWSSAKEAAWILLACINIFIGGLMPVFLFGAFVFGNDPNSSQFWPKAAIFTLGLLFGGALVLVGVQQSKNGARAIVGTDA